MWRLWGVGVRRVRPGGTPQLVGRRANHYFHGVLPVSSEVVFVPSAPLLVPRLAGPAATDTEPVRDAAVSALRMAAEGIERWVAIGVSDEAARGRLSTPHTGTFARFGVDVPVTLDPGRSDGATTTPAPMATPMPLSMLIAGWLRGQVGVVRMGAMLVGRDTTPEECTRIGTELAAELEIGGPGAEAVPIGVLVVGDGATALSAKAPGGGRRESAVVLQKVIDEAIGRPDPIGLAELGVADCEAEGVGGRAAWQVAVALCAGGELAARVDYCAAPFGVGYTVARWTAMPPTGQGS